MTLSHLAVRPIHPAGREERSCEAIRTCEELRNLHQGLRWRQLYRSQGHSRPLRQTYQHNEQNIETIDLRELIICSIRGSDSSDDVRCRTFLIRVAIVLLFAVNRINFRSFACS